MAAVSTFLHERGVNVLDAAQHATQDIGGTFFMRVVFTLEGIDRSEATLEEAFAKTVGTPFGMSWRISYADALKRMAILVSKYDHALLELLWRWRAGELPCDISSVISNHDDLRGTVEGYGIEYIHLPVRKGHKAEQEGILLRHLAAANVEVVVLARYMQILTPAFVRRYPRAIINIHHSFLPAFIGANPYRHAYDRGVKLIGATAHYVTDALDEGPIIEQDVGRVSHRDEVKDLMQLGREIERTVLARAVRAHLEDRILVYGNKTIVFD